MEKGFVKFVFLNRELFSIWKLDRNKHLKKGYEVKGDGPEKVFIPLSNKSTK